MKILVLYTRLTGYWQACMRYDVKQNSNEYLVIRKKPSLDAPFQINSENNIEIKDGDHLTSSSILELAKKFNPDLLYVAGWGDARYLKVALYYKKQNRPVITGMDNHFKGSLRQKLAVLGSKWRIQKYFTHIWVPGKPQYHYAKKLGFEEQKILNGLYCADESIFKKIKQTKFKKQLIFIGRLVDHKGVKDFCEVLNYMIERDELGLEIKIIGNGPLASIIPKHKNIQHISFITPEELPEQLENAGVFILPSTYEAWGVVVQEAALAWLPIITTYETGAASEFVIPGFNGFLMQAGNQEKLISILKQIEKMDEIEYHHFSSNSKLLSNKINLAIWSAQLNSVVL